MYSGIKTATDLAKAIDEFEERYKHPPARVMVNLHAIHLPETIGVSNGVMDVECGSGNLTPPKEHAFLYLKEEVIYEPPLEDFSEHD